MWKCAKVSLLMSLKINKTRMVKTSFTSQRTLLNFNQVSTMKGRIKPLKMGGKIYRKQEKFQKLDLEDVVKKTKPLLLVCHFWVKTAKSSFSNCALSAFVYKLCPRFNYCLLCFKMLKLHQQQGQRPKLTRFRPAKQTQPFWSKNNFILHLKQQRRWLKNHNCKRKSNKVKEIVRAVVG